MDYDDNDLQGHNLHLAGEESSKFSSVLRPYALPKFIFDDSLQGHLKFDNLVENEVFLGIPSQEDNHWIEDFSQGSVAIEFSSCATESCSISRRNNVWFEATSSESVEMLLKSVGQEETVRGETIIEESGAFDELGGLNERMEPHLKQEDKVKDVMDSEPALPSDEFQENLSRLIDDEGNQKAKISTHETSYESDPNISSETCGMKMSESNEEADRKRDDVYQTQVDNTKDKESLTNSMHKDSSGSGLQVCPIYSSSQGIIASVQVVNTEELEHQVRGGILEGGSHLFKDSGEKKADVDGQVLKGIAVDSGTHHLENLPSSPSKAQAIDQDAIETYTSNFKEPASLPLKGDNDLQRVVGCGDNLLSRETENGRKCGDLSNDTEIHQQFGGNMDEDLPVVLESNTNLEGHDSDISNKRAGTHVSSELLKIDQITNGENSSFEVKGLLPRIDHQLDSEASVSNSDASLWSGVDSKLFDGQGDGSSGTPVGDLSSMTVVGSSTELIGEKPTFEKLKGVLDGFGVHREDSTGEDHASSPVAARSAQMDKENLVSIPTDGHEQLIVACSSTELTEERHSVENLSGVHDVSRVQKKSTSDVHYSQDVSLNEKENANFPNDSGNVGCEMIESLSGDKRLVPTSQGEGMKVSNDVVHSPECVTFARSEPAVNVVFEQTNLASHDTEDGNPLLPETGATEDQVINILDNNNNTENEGPTETNLLFLKDRLEGAGEVAPVLELENDPFTSSGSGYSHEVVDQALSTIETCHSASSSKQSAGQLKKTVGQSLPMETPSTASGSQQAMEANSIGNNSSFKPEVCPLRCESAVKECGGDEGQGLIPGNHEGSAVEKIREVASLEVAAPVADKGEVHTELTVTLSGFDHKLSQDGLEGNEDGTPSGVTDCGLTAPTSQDFAEPNCGMPTMVSCTALCHSERDKKVEVKGSVQSTSPIVSGEDAFKEGMSFTFEVHSSSGQSEKEAKDGRPVMAIQACKTPMIVEKSPDKMDPETSLVPSRGSTQAAEGEIARGGSKSTPEHKTRRASGRATGKVNAKKGDPVKETTPVRLSERGDKSCSVPTSLSGTGRLLQFEGLKPYGNVERSGAIPCGVFSIPTSNFPDLNSSTPLPALVQLPFMDFQQVQLRAQIFVYGSLIQEAAPDEACMASAFGASDVERSIWEPAWRRCVERIQGVRPSDQTIKRGARQSKVFSSPLGRASCKDSPSPVGNSIIPLSSPLWNISTPTDGLQSSGIPRTGVLDYHQTPPSSHPLHTPLARSFVGNNTSWPSQAPFLGPWVASPVMPMTETVKLTPVKELSVPVSSGTTNAIVHGTGSSFLSGTSSLHDMKKIAALPGQNSADMKATKRKKVTVLEDLGQIPLIVQPRIESVSAPVVTCHLSTSVVVSTPSCFASEGNSSKIDSVVSPKPPIEYPKPEQNAEQKALMSEENVSNVEEAKRQAVDAAAIAAAAVSHSQSVWSQLDKQANSGLVPDVEAKLVAASVAIAAAASVAKAAATAAKIAFNAALQAKLMADDALASGRPSNPAQLNAVSLPPPVNILGKATPASSWKEGNGSYCSSSIIVAAREASRRRVEAASAASKHAENLDAIVKAAELAAEAVSQAGKVVAMGDSLALNELVEAGPEGYWRVPEVPSALFVTSNNNSKVQFKADAIEEGPNVPGRHAKEGLSEESKMVNSGLSPLSRGVSRDSWEDHTRKVDGITSSLTTSDNDSRWQRSRQASDLAKTIGVVPESELGSRSASITAHDEYEKGVGTLKENGMKEGCLVEVRKDGVKFKTAWFSANVLSLEGGKAFVCYTDLLSEEGQLKEWVALEGEANHAPRIRIAHPMTTMRFEGTRKRRREAMGDYVWSVGDQVDAWADDCWREGVVSENNKTDDSTLTVHFPADGEILVVKVWHLRPTLLWKDGEWIEGSYSREKDPSSQADAPREKRMKLGIPAIDGKEQDNMSKNIELGESRKPDKSRLLPLAANEKIFNLGKDIGDKNKPNALRTVRTGLQKEGPRVIFGVPKPGKKRKFMEVSKHFVAERSSKPNESTDSVKFAKYLMPQGAGSRGWKNTKIDAKEKQGTESKAKVLKSGNSQSVLGRTVSQKDNLLTCDGTAISHMVKESLRTDENKSGQQSLMGFGSSSNTEVAVEGPVVFSSLALPSDHPSKKISSSIFKSQQEAGKKLAPSSRKVVQVEVKDKITNVNPGKSSLEVAEPRRSNRRIQPTSRLLEGLQSSLTMSKIPSVSHDKSHRSQNRGTSKRE